MKNGISDAAMRDIYPQGKADETAKDAKDAENDAIRAPWRGGDASAAPRQLNGQLIPRAFTTSYSFQLTMVVQKPLAGRPQRA